VPRPVVGLVLGTSLGILLSLAGLALGGLSDASPEAQAKSGARADYLAGALMPREVYKRMIRQMSEGVAQGLQSSGATLPPDYSTKVATIVEEALPYAEQLQFASEIYSTHFNDREIEDLIKFYESSTGRKLVQKLPDITQATGAKVGTILPQRLPSLLKKHGLIP